MTIEIELQNASRCATVPSLSQFQHWLSRVLVEHDAAELLIRLVDEEESRQLNAQYRHLDKPTNVLSFPADIPLEIELPLLGDIVICAPLVSLQAAQQGKSLDAHWAHLTIHGVLHLLGYDHQDDAQAEKMESLETDLLDQLGFPDPY